LAGGRRGCVEAERERDRLVSHHLRALRAAGLVRSRREGKMMIYALSERGRALLGVILATSVTA
jgi:DNA-binding transcriptional ArsR family regulator